jgi:hypothetical protein
MVKLLEKAIAKVSTLPVAAQEKIGEELRSLDSGEGREIDIEHVIKRARAQYGDA